MTIGVSVIHALTLYSTEGCHLCDEAESLLGTLQKTGETQRWEVVDIANDDVLFKRYGWSIPVLRKSDGTELAWPFDAATLSAFLHSDAEQPP
ncbi:MAG: hypothetical protein ACI87W_001264 [Halieaceae bacterium]